MKMTAHPTRRKWLARGLRLAAFALSIALPAWAVFDHFPMWRQEGGLWASLGVGALLFGIIVAWTLRNALAAWLRRHLGGFALSQSTFWLGGVVILLILNTIAGIIEDLLSIWIAGTCGMLLGSLLLWLAQRIEGRDRNGTDGAEV